MDWMLFDVKDRSMWQVQEALFLAVQGKKQEAADRLSQLEGLFRKTGHVVAQLVATGYRGIVLATSLMAGTEAGTLQRLKARKLLIRSLYLAEDSEHAHLVREGALDLFAWGLSRLIIHEIEEREEGGRHQAGDEDVVLVGWFQLQRAPVMSLPLFRVGLAGNLLRMLPPSLPRRRRTILHRAHLQLREAAREVTIMISSSRPEEDGAQELSNHILFAYQQLGNTAIHCGEVSKAFEIFTDKLHREEVIAYRIGRLLVIRGEFMEALAMLASSLRCAVEQQGANFKARVVVDAEAEEEQEREEYLVRANVSWWVRLLIQKLNGSPPQHFSEAVGCSAVIEFVGPGLSPISPLEVRNCLGDALLCLSQWAGGIRYMEAVRAELLKQPQSSSAGPESPLLDYTAVLARGYSKSRDHCRAVEHIMFCREMVPELHLKLGWELSAASELLVDGKLEAAENQTRHVLGTLGFEIRPGCPEMNHADLLARAGLLLHQCGNRDSAVETLEQLRDICNRCSLDLTHSSCSGSRSLESIVGGLELLEQEYVRRADEAAGGSTTSERDHALAMYQNALHLAECFPIYPDSTTKKVRMSQLCFSAGYLHDSCGNYTQSLAMFADGLRDVLALWLQPLLTEEDKIVSRSNATTACRMVDRVLALLDGADRDDVEDLRTHVYDRSAPPVSVLDAKLKLGMALCRMSKPEAGRGQMGRSGSHRPPAGER